MNRTQQSTAIAICLLGLAVLAVGAVFLVREWREEVVTRQRLEEENARLRYEIDQLKAQSQLGGWNLRAADLDRIQALTRIQINLLEAQRQPQPPPNNDGS